MGELDMNHYYQKLLVLANLLHKLGVTTPDTYDYFESMAFIERYEEEE